MEATIVAALAGAISSFLSGLLGIGGALILTPLLLYAPGVVGAALIPVKIVTGLTVIQAISGSSIGLWRHRSYGNVSWRLVRIMGPVAAVASLAGALLSQNVSDQLLVGIFAVFAFAGAVLLRLPGRAQDAGVDDLHINVPLAIAIAGVVGFFGGMVGIGMFGSIAALIGKAATAQIDPQLALVVFVAAFVFSPLGAAISVRTEPRRLMGLLAAIMLLTGIRLAVTALTGV